MNMKEKINMKYKGKKEIQKEMGGEEGREEGQPKKVVNTKNRK